VTSPAPTPFDQRLWACRCDWGATGAQALAPADVAIVVDVLSFSTCVDIAAARGGVILPYRWQGRHPWNDPAAIEFARAHGAELAGTRARGARYSLAPGSFLDAPAGLRCVLPSPNGATLTLAATDAAPVLLAGCLRNARAVADAAAARGRTFNVIAAGERWRDGTLRPALEDWLGAGAILRHLPGSRSPEADAAVALFERYAETLVDTLRNASTGRELAGRGYPEDVEIAGALDVSDTVPHFDGVAYAAASPRTGRLE
jgi:2-phosphosulfolactate phosphatase